MAERYDDDQFDEEFEDLEPAQAGFAVSGQMEEDDEGPIDWAKLARGPGLAFEADDDWDAAPGNWDDSGEDWHRNLAEELSEDDLSQLGQRVCDWVDTDQESRREWQEREARGIRILGVTESTDGGADFEGASRVTHPMLILAMLQFQSRALKELWPAGGPCKTIVLGERTEERSAQSERVEGYMNYLYTEQMPGAFTELDRLLMRLPASGSVFKRVYRCPVEGEVVSVHVEPTRVHVPYGASDLRSAPRFTYEFTETEDTHRRKVYLGYYRDTPVQADSRGQDSNSVEEAIDDAQGTAPVDSGREDDEFQRYECACFLDLPGFEHVDEDGEPTGIGRPYLLTVDKHSQRVLRVARNWREGDPRERRRVHLVHYYFVPGFGFYGWGLYHLAGGLASAATGSLRSLLDAAYLANIKGGFVSRDLAIRMGKIKVEMGRWNPVDASPEELKSAFHEFQYDEPSRAMVELLGILGELGSKIGSTTENLIGEANNNAPVGTTLALIEQGLEVLSAIHQRLHESQRQELKLVAELVAEGLPEVYPYAVEGADREVMRSDFDERVDVVPVSDPNTVTNTQRLARAQSVIQLAADNPDLYDRRRAHRDMLEVMRVPAVDELIPDEGEVAPADPVAEGVALMTGRPVAVGAYQDHAAHIAVHTALFQSLGDQLREQVGPALHAHVAEHVAALYRQQMAAWLAQQGIELPAEGPLPPELEAALAQAMAQAPPAPLPDLPGAAAPGEARSAQDEQARDAQALGEIARKDALAEADIERKDRELEARIEREAAEDIQRSLLEAVRGQQAMTEQAMNPGARVTGRGVSSYGT